MFGVLFLHSFGSTHLEFQEFAYFLENQGFHTKIPLLPGHGTFPADLETKTFRDWIQASNNALKELNQTCQVIFIIGQMTGATLALKIAANHPELLGIVTLSGIITVPKWYSLIRPFLKYTTHTVNWGSKETNLISIEDKSIFKKVNMYEKVPTRSLGEVLNLIKDSRKHLKQVCQPIYVFHSTKSQDVSKRDTQLIFEGVSSKKKKLMYLDKGSSMMSIDSNRHIVYREVASFFWSCIDLYQM
ncbi:MAG: alpha/beta hydrolase [Candidatus Hodarchaeales archaeon]|jgi:carboxylesterase